jgi:hypothetical protein
MHLVLYLQNYFIESNVQDGGTLQMMQNKFEGQQEKVKTDNVGKLSTVGFGWATLQIDILRECIVISEAIQGIINQ